MNTSTEKSTSSKMIEVLSIVFYMLFLVFFCYPQFNISEPMLFVFSIIVMLVVTMDENKYNKIQSKCVFFRMIGSRNLLILVEFLFIGFGSFILYDNPETLNTTALPISMILIISMIGTLISIVLEIFFSKIDDSSKQDG